MKGQISHIEFKITENLKHSKRSISGKSGGFTYSCSGEEVENIKSLPHTDEWTPFHQKNLWYLPFINNIKISPEKKLNVIYTTLELLTSNNTNITVNKLLSNWPTSFTGEV